MLFLFVVKTEKNVAKLQMRKYEENLKKKILIIFSVSITLHFSLILIGYTIFYLSLKEI